MSLTYGPPTNCSVATKCGTPKQVHLPIDLTRDGSGVVIPHPAPGIRNQANMGGAGML